MDKLISIHDIAELFSLGRSAAYELTHRPGFPAPVVISSRCYRWPASEVAVFAQDLRQVPVKRRNGDGRRAGYARRITGTVRMAHGGGKRSR